MKGFTKDGKFRPITDHKGVRKSRDVSAKEQGVRLKKDGSRIKTLKFKVWKYEDAPPDLEEKILEKLRSNALEFNDTFFAEDEGLIFDDDEKKDASDIGLNTPTPKFFDVGSNRGTDFLQFRDLEIKDENKFAKYLGINKALQNRIEFQIVNDENRDMSNTTLEIVPPDENGGVFGEGNISENSALDDLWKYNNEEIAPEDRLTEGQLETLISAVRKFDNLISMAQNHLTSNYESQFTDETLKENAEANEWEFDEDGNIA